MVQESIGESNSQLSQKQQVQRAWGKNMLISSRDRRKDSAAEKGSWGMVGGGKAAVGFPLRYNEEPGEHKAFLYG